MKKIIISAITYGIINISAFGASIFSSDLDVYDCKTEDDARNCTRCKAEKDVTIRFKVNVEKSIVMLDYFEGKKNVGGPGVLEKCKIVDKKNWQCGSDSSYDQFNNFTQRIQVMTDGNYYSISRARLVAIPRFNIKASNSESFTCGK